MAWSLGPPAVQSTWRTAPGFRRVSSLASLRLARCHDARSDHEPSTPIERALDGAPDHSGLADKTHPGQRRHQVEIDQLWGLQMVHPLQQQQQEQEEEEEQRQQQQLEQQQQQEEQEQRKSVQQRPRHYHHPPKPIATNYKNRQWRQQQHQFNQGPDALMRAIMEATTVQQLQYVVHSESQAYINDDSTSPQTPTLAAKSEAASGPRSALWSSCGPPRMRPIHVAAAIVRLSKLPYNRNSGVSAVTGEPGDQSVSQEAPEDHHRQQLLQLLLQLACSQAGALTARQLVNVIWALGRMQADMARDGGAAAAAAAGGGAGGNASRSEMHMGATAAAATTPSIGQLEVLVSELLGERVQLWRWEDGEEVASCCREGEGEDWVSERGSLGALPVTIAAGKVRSQLDAGLTPPGASPPPPPGSSPRPTGKLPQASNREVANFAWAAAQLGLRSLPLWAAVLREAEVRLQKGRAKRIPSGGDGSEPLRVPAPATGSGSEPFNATDLANLSWALARAGQLPGGALAELLVRVAMEQIEEFDAVSLAGLIWGLGTLAASTLPAALTSSPALQTHHGNAGGGGGGGGGVLGDLLPLLLQRATPRVVSELAQQRMRPREVVSVALGLSAAATARRPCGGGDGGWEPLLQVLADYVTSNTPAFVSCDNRRTVRGGGVRHAGLDNLANVLLALVRCVEARADGRGGQYPDPRVARRVERALESAARQVVLRNLPGASPESLAALAVTFSNRVTGRGGTGSGSGSGSGGGGATVSVDAAADANAATKTMAAPAALGTESPNDLIAASSSGLLPSSPSLAGPVVPPIRQTVLRALLRAAVRLLPALPLPSSSLQRRTKVSVTVGGPNGGGGGDSNNGGGGGGLRSCHMREVVGVLWWCIQGLGGGADGAVEELRLAAPWIERALPLCRPADLALLAAVYARAGCHAASLEAALSAAGRSAASAMSPLDISQMAWAAATTANTATVAKAGANTAAVPAGRDALLISALELRATELLQSGAWPSGKELAVLMWSFAKLNHYSEPFLNAVVMVLRPTHGAIVTPAVLPARQAKAPSAKTAPAPAGAVASARLESPTVLQPLLQLSPHEVAMVAAALGQLRYFDSVLMRSLAARVEVDVDRYSGRALTWALSAFACLNSHHPGLLRASTVRVRQLLRIHHHLPPLKWRPAVQPGLVSERADVDDGGDPLTAFDAVALLWSFGVLQHVDLECLQGLIGILPRDPRVYSVSDLSRLGLADVMLRGALARLRHRRNVHMPPRPRPPSHPAATAASTNTSTSTSTGNASAAGGGVLHLAEDELAVLIQGGLLPKPLRAAVAAAARSQRSHVSGLQREVAAALRGMGLRPRMEVAMGVFSLDLRLDLPKGWQWEKQQPQQSRNEVAADGSGGGGGDVWRPNGTVRIAVEVDGPSHFCSNVPNHAMGSTVARDRCLLDLSLQLVVVPHFEWDTLQSAEAKRAYLARRLAAAAAPQHDEPTGRHEAAGRHTDVDNIAGIVRGSGGGAGRPSASRALFPAMTITTQVVRRSTPVPAPAPPPPTSLSSSPSPSSTSLSVPSSF